MAAATARATVPRRRTAPSAKAAASAGRPATRRQPVRRSSPAPRRRRRGNTPITGFVPVAVGRTAGAVGGLADSGLVVRLTRSRLWIGLLGGLLVGIVALNVLALSFSASSSDAARQAEELKRLNSELRGDLATRLSSAEVQAAASKLGLVIPEPGSIRYVHPSAEDAAEAARRLRDGDLAASDYYAPVTTVAPEEAVVAEQAVVSETAEAVPVADPAAVAPEAEPAATETAAVEAAAPAAPEPAAAPAVGGGVAAP